MQQSSVAIDSQLIRPLKVVVRDLNKLESLKQLAIDFFKITLGNLAYQNLLIHQSLSSIPDYKDYKEAEQDDRLRANPNRMAEDPVNEILDSMTLFGPAYSKGKPDRYKSILKGIDKANSLMIVYSATCTISSNVQDAKTLKYLRILLFVEKFVAGAKQEIQSLIGGDDQKQDNALGDDNQNEEDYDNDEKDQKEEVNFETRANILTASKGYLNTIVHSLNAVDAMMQQYLKTYYGKKYWDHKGFAQHDKSFNQSTYEENAWNELKPDEATVDLLVRFGLNYDIVLGSGGDRRIAESRLNGQEAFLLYDHPEIEELILRLDFRRYFGKVEFCNRLLDNAIRYTQKTMLSFKKQIESVLSKEYSTDTIVAFKKRRLFLAVAKKMFQTVISKVDQFTQELSNNIDDEEKSISALISNSNDEEESKNPINLNQEQTNQTHSISQDILQDNTNTREPFNNDLILNQENIDLTQEKGGKKRLTRQSFSQDAFLETKEEKEPIDLEVLETKSQDHSEIPPQVSKLKINIAIGLMMFSVFLAIIFFTPIAHKLLVNFGKQVGSPLGLHLALAILLGAAFTAGAVLLWLAYKQACKADEMHQNNRQLLIHNTNNRSSLNLNGLHQASQALVNHSNTHHNQAGQTIQITPH